jgi:hypothetical protein
MLEYGIYPDARGILLRIVKLKILVVFDEIKSTCVKAPPIFEVFYVIRLFDIAFAT